MQEDRMLLTGGFVRCSSSCTALGCTWWEKSRTDSLWHGGNGAGMSCSKHRAQTASHRRWEYPIPPARPSFGAKDQQSPQWCCELPPPKRSYWELQIARALLYWKSEWLSSGVKVSIFVFWPHWFGSHLTAWIIQKCASAGKANYATLAFQILNWKIYIKHAEVRQHFWIFFVFVSRHGWKGRIVKWWKVSPMRPFLSNWIK